MTELEKNNHRMEFRVNNASLCLFKELCTEYSNEIIWILQESELNRLTMRYISPQLRYRTVMVNFIQQVGERQQLRRLTVHLAIYMMDAFMDNHNIADIRLNLLALCCILLASKVEENEPNVPSLEKLNEVLKRPYPQSDFAVLEVLLLKFFKWHLIIPTTSAFVEYWVLNIVSRVDFASTITEDQYYDRRTRAVELVLEFLDVTILDIKMTNIRPSLLASACMAAARSLLPVVKIWNANMIEITGYSYDEINCLTRELMNWRAYLVADTIRRKQPIPDSGYTTDADNVVDFPEYDEVEEEEPEDDSEESDDEIVFIMESKRAKRD